MFGKKNQPPIKSLIAQGSTIEGNLKFAEGLRVDGDIVGDGDTVSVGLAQAEPEGEPDTDADGVSEIVGVAESDGVKVTLLVLDLAARAGFFG